MQEEQVQNDALANYTSNVTQLLRVNEIFESLNILIKQMLKNWNMVAFTLVDKSGYQVVFSSNPLECLDFCLDENHPLATYMKETNSNC